MLSDVARAVRKVVGHRGHEIDDASAADGALIRDLQAAHLTYLTVRKLSSIAATCRRAEQEGLAGVFIEAGCALGGSTILLARTKRRERELRVYDVFGMIPEPSAVDGADVQNRYEEIKSGKSEGIAGDVYYGYEPDLYSKVKANLGSFGVSEDGDNVRLIKGLLQETLLVDTPVAFAHVDVDWYDPVRTCLERIVPHLVAGGSIILDDYNDWSGCRKATDEFFNGMWKDYRKNDRAGSLKITRIH